MSSICHIALLIFLWKLFRYRIWILVSLEVTVHSQIPKPAITLFRIIKSSFNDSGIKLKSVFQYKSLLAFELLASVVIPFLMTKNCRTFSRWWSKDNDIYLKTQHSETKLGLELIFWSCSFYFVIISVRICRTSSYFDINDGWLCVSIKQIF